MHPVTSTGCVLYAPAVKTSLYNYLHNITSGLGLLVMEFKGPIASNMPTNQPPRNHRAEFQMYLIAMD